MEWIGKVTSLLYSCPAAFITQLSNKMNSLSGYLLCILLFVVLSTATVVDCHVLFKMMIEPPILVLVERNQKIQYTSAIAVVLRNLHHQ